MTAKLRNDRFTKHDTMSSAEYFRALEAARNGNACPGIYSESAAAHGVSHTCGWPPSPRLRRAHARLLRSKTKSAVGRTDACGKFTNFPVPAVRFAAATR